MSNIVSAADHRVPPAATAGLVFTSAEGPAKRDGSGWLASAVLGFACFMTVIASLTWVWGARVPASPVDDRIQAATAAPAWVEIMRPLATYDLAGGAYAKLPMRYEARRLEGGVARQDILTYGTTQPGEAFVRLVFDRHEPQSAVLDSAGDATLFVDTARLAAGAGLAITRSSLPWSVATRFGPFETADVTASRGSLTGSCVALRRDTPVLSVTGLMCGVDAKAPGPVAVACTLDKLDLVSAGDDIPLRDLFVAAERQRGLGCVDSRTARLLPDDPLRPLSAALRGSLPTGRDPGVR